MEQRVKREFKKDDMVVYKPWENCSGVDISNPGRVEEVLTGEWEGFYMVRFGLTSIHGTRLGRFHWSYLYIPEKK